MPRDEELVGTYISRPESPEVEMLIQETIGCALVDLLANKGLYQNVELDLSSVAEHTAQIGSSSADELKAEFSRRPWVPISPGLTNENLMRAEFFCGVSDSPLSAPSSELKISFPMPGFKGYCGKCRDDHSFTSIGVLWADGFLDYFPRMSEKTEQLFNFHYNCSICRDNIIGFLVKRTGLRLSLCGRSERPRVETPKIIPKKLRPIMADALGAVSENDVFAGFYHLRTFCEHYMKSCLGLSVEERIIGEELCEKYNGILDRRMTSDLPSMVVIYDTSSKYMHSRAGDRGEFRELLNQVEGHLKAKELFEQYG
ncbi:hypothetical protein [Halomonas kalidii]|uniref:Uncharacterized protein n=1 Tax=Halomonas kalidii TaxID=3043293 RepID=A0ABT6VQU5_9GAMM|nr:hypothetical protein [Halomonas kalidii]MDI5936357.1 hypothetical protein [Halomonas kalidii]